MMENAFTDEQQPALSPSQHLLEEGYLVLEDVVSPTTLRTAYCELDLHFKNAPFCDGPFYGATTKRFGRLLNRLSAPAEFVLNARVMDIVRVAFGEANGIQLNLSQAIEIHPGAPVQVPHRDQDMWRFEKGRGTTYMINVMWPLDDFTHENGATRLWPRSNQADYDMMLPAESDATYGIAKAGSAILFLGQTLHSGGANRGAAPRRGMIFSYCLDWLLPDENPWLAYPPHIARSFPAELAALAGYRQRFAGLNNFEGRDPAVLLGESLPEYLQFSDDMSPEQNELIAGYYHGLDQRCVN